MVAVVRPQMLAAVAGGLRALGAAPRGRRRGDRHRRAARVLGRRGRRRDPGAAPHRRVPALPRSSRGRAPSRSAGNGVSTRRRAGRRCSSCSARRTSAAARGSTGATTTSSARAPCGGPGSTRPCCACGPATAGSRSRSTARAASARLDPRTGGALAVLEAARNVACAGGEPLGLTDCLNFGNPEKGEIAWELAEAIEGMARGLRGARRPGRLRQRLALQRDRRPRDPPDAGRRLRRARRGRAARARARGARAT